MLRLSLGVLAICLVASLTACTAESTPPPPSPAARAITLRYDIEGMHCDGCVQAITGKVTGIAGVTGCTVSLEEHRAEIQVTEESLAPAIEEAITKLGYKVSKQA